MHSNSFLVVICLLKAAIAVVAFLLPGWLVARRVRTTMPIVCTFMASSAILVHIVLLLCVVGIPLHLGTVGAGLLLTSALLAWRLPPAPKKTVDRAGIFRKSDWLWWLSVAFGLASIAVRAVIDPLSGYDNNFRWDYLAKLMLAQHSLSGYPPVHAADFSLYSWCDGIPPLVAIQNFWLYAVTGSTAAWITSIRVAGETLLIGTTLAALSREFWGHRSAAIALAILCSSPLMLWAIAMGQETGVTALTFSSLLYFLVRSIKDPSPAVAFWAGIAAGLGALSREYGLAFIIFGAATLLISKASSRSMIAFLVTALGIAAPWYVRNWIITGNPIYPQAFFGLFRTNSVHTELMHSIAVEARLARAQTSPEAWWTGMASLGGLAVCFGVLGAIKGRRRTDVRILAAGGLLMIALWLWSVPQTAGGWIYSMRVLSPFLAIVAVLAGWLVECSRPLRFGCALLVAVFAIDASRRTWFLPRISHASPWPITFAPWRETKQLMESVEERPMWEALINAAQGQCIVVDHPLYHALIAMRGGLAAPLVSPLLEPTLASAAPFSEVVAELRRRQIRFIALTPASAPTHDFISAHPFWHELVGEHTPNARGRFVTIFDLADLKSAATPAARRE